MSPFQNSNRGAPRGSACLLFAALLPSVALALQAPRTWDLVTYHPPSGFNVVEKPSGNVGHVELTKASSSSYCVIAIHTSTPSASDLSASFAAEWQAVALKTISPVAAPAPTIANLGATRAAIGSASSTVGGQPVWAQLVVLDAGPSVVSLLILAPNQRAFRAYQPDVDQMLSSLIVKQATLGQLPAPVPSQVRDGKLIIPPAPRTLTVADLAGEWGLTEGITTHYVDRYTGAHAGSDSLHFTSKWTISKEGGISLDFFAIRNGKKIIEKSSGTVALVEGVLVIKMTNMQRYVVRGWLERPELTVLKLNGPWYDAPIPSNIFTNPDQGANLDQNWVRKK